MSRRKGQIGRIERHGQHYTLRVWMDVDGRVSRKHLRIPISPVDEGSPGWLNASERQNRAKQIIAEMGINSPQRFNAVVSADFAPLETTFRDQAKTFIDSLRGTVSKKTFDLWNGCIDNWLIPMLGDLPLEKVGNRALKGLVAWMKEGGPLPSGKDGQ